MMQTKHRNRRKWLIGVGVVGLLLIAMVATLYWYMQANRTVNHHKKQELVPLHSAQAPQQQYDVIVVGTDPEGVAAAVSAARNELRVLLVEPRQRTMLGGLMTHGALNTLDLSYRPVAKSFFAKHIWMNDGIFQEFFDQIEGSSFDVNTAANAFAKMVQKEANIDLIMAVNELEPMLEKMNAGAEAGGAETAVTGVRFVMGSGASKSTHEVMADLVIDATQDGDVAAAAGAPFTFGREDIGEPEKRMAVTLVIKLGGVTQKVWDSFAEDPNTNVDLMTTWGFKEAAEYVSQYPERVRMRALNIGRQNDETLLINAMHIFDVNPLDPDSMAEALRIGQEEAPRIVDFLKSRFKQLEPLTFAGTADELYVRESRHFEGEYRLTITDVLENRDHHDAIGYGSYDVDIQSTSHQDNGIILLSPIQYGIPFRSLVPKQVDKLLIVGRAASFDTLPHGSARVMPTGMAAGQAAGVAAKLAAENKISVRLLSQTDDLVTELRNRLKKQGVDLTKYDVKAPSYMEHPDYPGLVTAVNLVMAAGFMDNSGFALDDPSNAKRFVNKAARLPKMFDTYFKGNAYEALQGMEQSEKEPLSLDLLVKILALTIDLEQGQDWDVAAFLQKGWLKQETIDGLKNKAHLTDGESYMVVRDLMEGYPEIVY